MNGNAKQRTTLTNLTEPQQMRELNRQLTWIWDQLLGGLSMKSLNSGARKVIDSKASSEDVDALGNVVSANSTSIVQTAEKIEATATKVQTLDDRVTENESRILQTPEQIRMAVQRVEIGGRNLLTKTKTLENAASGLGLWQTVSAQSRSEGEDGIYQIDWKVTGLTEDVRTALRSPLFRLPDGWMGRKIALSFWVKAEDWETLDGGMEARICLTVGDRAEDYRWVRMKMLGAGGAADEDLSGDRPVNGQWRRVWALAELSQEGLNGSGMIGLPEEAAENGALKITKQPENANGQLNGTVYFTVEAAGAAAYQWQYRTADGTTWYDWAGQTTEMMTLRLTSEGRLTNVYRCRLTDADGNELYTNEVLAYEPDVVFGITKQPESVDGQLNDTVYFTVEATGAAAYQWQYRTPNGTKWTNWAGQTTETMTLKLTTAARAENLYRCEIRDVNGLIFVTDTVMVRKPLASVTHGWAGVFVKRNADFSLKAPQLEFGDRPSDWSPAPGDADEELTRLESELVVQEDEIALRVKQETLDAAINGVQVGGTNLVSCAEGRVSIWDGAGGIDRAWSKSYYCQSGVGFNMTPNPDGQHGLVFDSQIKLTEGDYTLSFWCWRSADSPAMTVHCNLLSSEKDHYFRDITPRTAAPELFRVSISVDYAASAALRFIVDGFSAGHLFFTDVKLEKGNKATDWSPAPEDVEDSIDKLSAELVVESGRISAEAARATEAEGVLAARMDATAEQILLEVEKKQNISDPAAGVDTGTGSSVRVRITADEFDVDVPGEDGDFTLNRTGARIPVVNADVVKAGNLACRYDGPAALYVDPNATSEQIAAGGYFRSLSEACAALSGMYLDKAVSISMRGNVYGHPVLIGVNGTGNVRINGGGYMLYGTFLAENCGVSVHIDGLKATNDGGNKSWTVGLWNVAYAEVTNCAVSGHGKDADSECLALSNGSAAFVMDSEFYNANHLIWMSYLTRLQARNLKGGSCNNFISPNGCEIRWAGTRPDGAVREMGNPSACKPDDLSTLPIDYGTAQPSVPVIQTAEFSYLHSDSYVGGWGYYGNDDIYQGVVRTSDAGDTAAAFGVIWFDQAAMRSALNGKTINQVSLRLHMHKGVGRGAAVSVELWGTNAAYDGRSGAPDISAHSYGTIGTTEPDTVSEITIPTQVIADILSGTIQALVLKSSDDELYKDRDYSRNYARFSGSTSATAENCPRLTVVYQ